MPAPTTTSGRIHVFRTLRDNHTFLVWPEGSRRTLVIDPSEAEPVLEALEQFGLELALVINTHHHEDHIGGNEKLSERFGAPIVCSQYDLARIPGATRGLLDRERLDFDGLEYEVIAVPGHTLGQIALYFPGLDSVFVGDTLFAMGCGRLFEGTAAQMWSSLKRIMSLPLKTRLHFGHEYTHLNGPFARTIEPENAAVDGRCREAKVILDRGRQAIVPAPTLAEELLVNPFLRATRPEFRALLGVGIETPDVEVFRHLRERRDHFNISK